MTEPPNELWRDIEEQIHDATDNTGARFWMRRFEWKKSSKK